MGVLTMLMTASVISNATVTDLSEIHLSNTTQMGNNDELIHRKGNFSNNSSSDTSGNVEAVSIQIVLESLRRNGGLIFLIFSVSIAIMFCVIFICIQKTPTRSMSYRSAELLLESGDI